MRLLLAAALVVEGLLTGLWVARLLPTLVVYPLVTLAVVGARALVGALQFASGWMLVRRVLPAVTFARWAFLASAVLLTIELGARLSPSSLFPSLRWPVIGGYWVYALAAVWYLRRSARSAQ